MCQPMPDDWFPAPLTEEQMAEVTAAADCDTWTWDTRVTLTGERLRLVDEPAWFGPVTEEQIAEAITSAPPDNPPSDAALDDGPLLPVGVVARVQEVSDFRGAS